jgi:hypothetical protein
MKTIVSCFLVPAPKKKKKKKKKKLKKDGSESLPHLVASTRLLETTCSELNEDLTSKVANTEKQNANHSCYSFHSQSLSASSDVLEKDVVATQTLGYSGSKLHQETSKSSVE